MERDHDTGVAEQQAIEARAEDGVAEQAPDASLHWTAGELDSVCTIGRTAVEICSKQI